MTELKHKKITIVDDDHFVSEMYNHHLKNEGYKNVSVCNDGTELLAQLTSNPEIIFLDYQMDNINGFDLLQKIKRFDPNIIVVMVSGQGDMNIAIDSLKYGAFDYIIKGKSDTENMTAVLDRIEIYLKQLTSSNSKVLQNIKSIFKIK